MATSFERTLTKIEGAATIHDLIAGLDEALEVLTGDLQAAHRASCESEGMSDEQIAADWAEVERALAEQTHDDE